MLDTAPMLGMRTYVKELETMDTPPVMRRAPTRSNRESISHREPFLGTECEGTVHTTRIVNMAFNTPNAQKHARQLDSCITTPEMNDPLT